MIARVRPRLLQTRFTVARRSSLAFHHVFIRFPRFEFGLSAIDVTRIACHHPGLAGHRAIHITDLHLDLYQPRHDALRQVIADLRPSWIFVTGDLLTVKPGLPHLFRFLSALRDLAPVFLTLGNHDHYSGVPPDVFGELADRHRLHLLINQTTFVPLRRGDLAIVGLDDPSLHRADPACIPARRPDRFTIVLAHAPNVMDLLDHSHAVDFILCGHSHGGQCRLRSLRSLWLPYGCNRRASGHYHERGHRMYVNRGIGWSMLPMRVNCPPEVVVLEWY